MRSMTLNLREKKKMPRGSCLPGHYGNGYDINSCPSLDKRPIDLAGISTRIRYAKKHGLQQEESGRCMIRRSRRGKKERASSRDKHEGGNRGGQGGGEPTMSPPI